MRKIRNPKSQIRYRIISRFFLSKVAPQFKLIKSFFVLKQLFFAGAHHKKHLAEKEVCTYNIITK